MTLNLHTLSCHTDARCYDSDCNGKLHPVDGVKYGAVTVPVSDGYEDITTVDWFCSSCGKVWRERSRLFAVEHVGDRDLGDKRELPEGELVVCGVMEALEVGLVGGR